MSITRSPYTPPIGSQVRFSTCGTIATVTGHTDRGFTYKDGPKLCIPRLGVCGTDEGECYTDVSGWDSYVIRFESKVEAEAVKHDQFEPTKLIAVTERLRIWSNGERGLSLDQLREDVIWLLDSHLYYYQALERAQKALVFRKNGDYEQTWQDRAEELEAESKELRNE